MDYSNQKGIAHLFVLLMLLLGIGLGVYLVTQKTNLLPKASSEKVDFYGMQINTLKIFGQKKLGETTRNKPTANTVYHAAGLAIDRTSTPNKIYVVDTGNNRILGFNGIGFCNKQTTRSCNVNGDCGRGDSCKVDGTKNADLVIGQANFEEGACNRDNNLGIFKNTDSSSLCLLQYPNGSNIAEAKGRITIDTDGQGNLYVPDIYNNRVLKYNKPLSSSKIRGGGDGIADFVWGQDDFSGHFINRGTTNITPSKDPDERSLWLNAGAGVTVDPTGNIWVADKLNNRVLRFPPNSKSADLVLGQTDFDSKGCVENGPLNKFCTPLMARVRPDTGDLYVLDNFAGFGNRIMVFKVPFTNGMSASKIIIPKDAAYHNKPYKFERAWSLVFNTFKEGEYQNGVLWVQDAGQRTLLLDDDGNVIKVIGAKDKNSFGGDEAYQGCYDIYDGGLYGIDPGGSFGFDNEKNIYFANDLFNRVSRYSLPYNTTTINGKTCLPKPNGGVFKDSSPNKKTLDKVSESVGIGVFGDQLVYQDEWKLKIWNNYLNQLTGAPADFEVGGNDNLGSSRRQLSQAKDDQNRLWLVTDSGLRVYQLPFQNQTDLPLAKDLKLYWVDDKSEIQTELSGVAFENLQKKLYFADVKNNRLLRVSNINSFKSEKLLVDLVIGQPNKSSTSCNHGSSTPVADGLCTPTQIVFDKLGNLFVIENSYECQGNDRITVFLREDLSSATGLFPKLAAKKAFVGTLTKKGPCGYTTIDQPGSPVSIAFDSKNRMVVGNDGYYGKEEIRHLKQLWYYQDPLNKQTPDASIKLPMGAAGEIVFDTSDNLIVQDHTWSRSFLINLETDPIWLEFLPGVTPRPSPTIVPTPSFSPTPTPLPPVGPGSTRIPSSSGNTRATPKPTLKPDQTLPKLTITKPRNLAAFRSNANVVISAKATDNIAVSKVEFYRNDELICTLKKAPYTCRFKMPQSLVSIYTITVKAYDGSDNLAQKSIKILGAY